MQPQEIRRIMNQDRLNALAIISTEKKLLKSRTDISENVIDLFARNKTRMDFIFK